MEANIKLTFWRSIIWTFSKLGRLKYSLALAVKLPQDQGKINKVTSALQFIISDKKTNHLFQEPVLLIALDFIYCYAGPKICLNLLNEGCADYLKLSAPKAIMALCECPDTFVNKDDALSSKEQINSKLLEFSSAMCRDAYLVQTKVAEWQEDVELMLGSIKKALELDSTHQEANYWLIRSRLHSSELLVGTLNIEKAWLENARWKRLDLAVKLHDNKDFDSVKSLITVLENDFDKPDFQEQILLLDLIGKLLKPSLDRNKDDLRICAGLSKSIREIFPELGWATVNIALNLIINEFQYDSAFEEIHRLECSEEELTPALQQITGFISDKLKFTKNLHPSIAKLQQAKEYLILSDLKKPLSVDLLAQTLKAHLSDSWVVSLPVLTQSAKALLALLSQVEGDHKGTDELVQCLEDDKLTPTWLRWLILRILLLDPNINNQLAYKLFVPDQNLSIALALLCWVDGYATPETLATYREIVLGAPNGKQFADLLNKFGWNELLTNNQIIYPGLSTPGIDFEILSASSGFSNSLRLIIEQDLEISKECNKARSKINNGEILEAEQDLQQTLKKVLLSCIVIKSWWQPFVCYWLSVTQARLGNDTDAITGFHSLLKGPKSEEAKSQLALLALKHNQLSDASKWLDSTDSRFPAVFYSKALLVWRKGDAEEAKSLLASYHDQFGGACRHYRFACLRLLASIYECTNQPEKAMALLTEIQEISPKDIISSIRLSRLITKEVYHNYSTQRLPAEQAALSLLDVERLMASAASTCREQKCSLFLRILADSGEKLAKQNLSLIPQTYAWYQLLLQQLLAKGYTETAVTLLKHGSLIHKIKNPPPYFERTQFIVILSHFLRHVWLFLLRSIEGDPENGKIKISDFQTYYPEFGEAGVSLGQYPEIFLRCIKASINTGIKIGHSGDHAIGLLIATAKFAESIWLNAPLPHDNADQDNLPSLRLISAIYKLCFQSEPYRNQSLEEEILQLGRSDLIPLTEAQRAAAIALALWSANDMAGFLDHLTFENSNEPLPFNDEHLWLAKATAWFKTSMFRSILESEIPDSLADLSNYDVSLLLAITSARMAVESSKKENSNTHNALLHIRKAASALDSIIENK